jgi:hypothetical protein
MDDGWNGQPGDRPDRSGQPLFTSPAVNRTKLNCEDRTISCPVLFFRLAVPCSC